MSFACPIQLLRVAVSSSRTTSEPEAMAQVVEAQGSKPGAFLSTAQAAPYRRVVERLAEHKVLVIDETATVGETCQLGRGGRGERDRARPTPLRGLELPGRHGGGYCEGAPLEAHLPPAQRGSSPSLKPVKAATV